MKKLILSLAIVAVATLSANAQTGQGTWLIGGSAGFSSSSVKGESGSVSEFSINPKAGYFFADDFAAGASVGFNSESSGGFTSSTFGIGPFVRYYFLPIGDNAKLFGNASFGFGSTSPGGGESSVSSTGWQIAAGPAFFLNEHTALEATVGYGSSKPSGGVSTGTFEVAVGFQIHIHSTKSKK